MKKLNCIKFIVFLTISMAASISYSEITECSPVLSKFAKDCEIQIQWNNLKDQFKNEFNISMNEIAEYKALRFIDRTSWQFAKVKPPQKNISQIYKPNGTWEYWNEGIDELMTKYSNLPYFLSSDAAFRQMITEMNHKILFEVNKRKPIRDFRAEEVGFCEIFKEDKIIKLENSRESMEIYQNEWDLRMKTNLSKIMRSETGRSSFGAAVGGEVFKGNNLGPSCSAENSYGYKQMWISFTASHKVENNLQWLRVFLKWNLNKILSNDPNALAPIELAAVVQKWFVSIHPFPDGNGRTSRALQDLIHQYFNLPYVPSGDLQEDIYTNLFDYIDLTYRETDKMYSKMNGCLDQRRQKNWKNEFEKYACQVLKNGKML